MDWNDTTIARLKALWAEGHSASRIADMMGATKNAIVGKAHRLCLPTRPSPIRAPDPNSRRRRPRVVRPGQNTLPPTPARPAPSAATIVTPVLTRPTIRPVPAPEPAPAGVHSARKCEYITGGRKGEPEFCGADRCKAASPYCHAHHVLCFVAGRERQEKSVDDYVWR